MRSCYQLESVTGYAAWKPHSTASLHQPGCTRIVAEVRYNPGMTARVGCLAIFVVLAASAAGCAHSPDTVVHVSAANDARWEVRDSDNHLVCSLPCSVELDEEDAVNIVRVDGAARFELRQENLGDGQFTASVRTHRKERRSNVAARAFAAALTSAGSVLVKSEDKDQVVAGAVLSGMGAMVRVASEDVRGVRQELWVQRTSTPAE